METLTFEPAGIFAPNPAAKRANRVKWDIKPSTDGSERVIAYGTLKNVVIRDLNDPKKTKIYNQQVLNDVTCVRYD